ncbi:LuxR C-terminal-related transcriptional regulator [Pseudarthrobacter sp. AB1]|uniref:LuxR C-terminal-related transcriptional regulator n=1 Tax=Pseudarthrobacter sp. AB1 TaxID=2138309 RepID=UPI00186BAEBF|nr:LuxR C-terminal-related transcriptional regulator [Pseudarthrobacter sp. AB1]MBE4718907.1 LuxR family transcriptional regulator [Pseudarthrobacter sp. AB1]
MVTGQPHVTPHAVAEPEPSATGGPQLVAQQLRGANAAVRELLLALSVGFTIPGPLPRELLRKVAGDGADGLDSLVARAELSGFLQSDGAVAGTARHALLNTTSTPRIHALQRELVGCFVEDGLPLGDLARELARSGLADHRVAAELEKAGDRALERDPGLAAQLYEEALLAGADELGTASRRALAASATGDLDSAGRIVDVLLVCADPPDLRLGVDVAAAVWAQRGLLARCADVYTWLGPERVGPSAPSAAVAMIGCGNRAGAETMFPAGSVPESPTLLAVAQAQTGQGILASLAMDPHQVLPILIHASDMMNASGAAVPVPDTPGALAALVALHSGEPYLAETIVRAATTAVQGGDAAKPRLFLIQAWCAMQQDNPDDARLAINEACKANHWPLVPRDEFLCAALEVGLARRSGEVHDLLLAWERAREAMLHTSVDLYSLLPWGELMITAARLRETRRISLYLDGAWKLLQDLGEPPLWAVPMHWAAVQAALLSDSPADLAPHAAALARAADHSHLASVLAAAGKVWVSVLAGKVRAADVEAAARGLNAVGMPWEGARLAGHAAARASERKDMVRLLSCARDLHPQGSAAGANTARQSEATSAAAADQGNSSAQPDGSMLSEREKDVARLVLEGKTYREIGEAIYISPRTAEHHIARMRRRLGAENRSDLLVRLRLALGSENPKGSDPLVPLTGRSADPQQGARR